MDIEIFTNGSKTVNESSEKVPYKEYFGGQFRPIQETAKMLEEFGEVRIHIISDEVGYVEGDEIRNQTTDAVTDIPHISTEKDRMADEIVRSAEDSDVIFVSLLSNEFENIVFPIWQTVNDKVNSNSIWCLGASQNILESLELTKFGTSIEELIIYKRVGVARIGKETRRELISCLRNKQTNTISPDPGVGESK